MQTVGPTVCVCVCAPVCDVHAIGGPKTLTSASIQPSIINCTKSRNGMLARSSLRSDLKSSGNQPCGVAACASSRSFCGRHAAGLQRHLQCRATAKRCSSGLDSPDPQRSHPHSQLQQAPASKAFVGRDAATIFAFLGLDPNPIESV